MADALLQKIGELINRGYGVGQATRGRMPILYTSGNQMELPMVPGSPAVLGIYNPGVLQLTTQQDSRRPVNWDTAALGEAFGRPAAAVAADRDPRMVFKTTRHESAHDALAQSPFMVRESVFADQKAIPAEAAQNTLNALSRQAKLIIEGGGATALASGAPSYLNEAIASLAESPDPTGLRSEALLEINGLLQKQLGMDRSPLVGVLRVAHPDVMKKVGARLASWQDIIDLTRR